MLSMMRLKGMRFPIIVLVAENFYSGHYQVPIIPSEIPLNTSINMIRFETTLKQKEQEK
jgi:hypothetical protein